ncbi:TspO/MBR family protein [Sphingomicrobium lutaoense]|uniref:Tryptophan-rich sensory protein n=1 Tax=Sphingomicrobium lutaoense TaxID=515949 RepID=A0A839Z1G6_9SPHN|nr:TspO/MBR family protein [Sphingomicrobium lutaoense]MBB3763425.1 tryptophan-rich sensory protein [Sphingomicrobium lutaoense]
MTPSNRAIARRTLWLVPLIVIGGSLSGVAFSPDDWYRALEKPSFQPPSYLFGIVWPLLYAMMGLALAVVLAHPPGKERKVAVTLFLVQLALNFSWSCVFFGAHAISTAKWLLYAILVFASMTAGRFWRIRPLAGALMLPYLAWLIFAAVLNGAIERMNPGAGSPLFG